MSKSIKELLQHNGWKERSPATDEDINHLKEKFRVSLPDDYEQLLRFSNGGSLYGFSTPFIVYSPVEVLALYKEGDLYINIPKALIFGGDGGGTLYCFDLRIDPHPVFFVREDEISYDDAIYKAASLTDTIQKVINNEKLN